MMKTISGIGLCIFGVAFYLFGYLIASENWLYVWRDVDLNQKISFIYLPYPIIQNNIDSGSCIKLVEGGELNVDANGSVEIQSEFHDAFNAYEIAEFSSVNLGGWGPTTFVSQNLPNGRKQFTLRITKLTAKYEYSNGLLKMTTAQRRHVNYFSVIAIVFFPFIVIIAGGWLIWKDRIKQKPSSTSIHMTD